MNKTFKCCKNKEFGNYCCIVCASIFHPSCLERMKEAVNIGGYRIYCSLVCHEKAADLGRSERQFMEKIKALEDEIKNKNRYITRLKRTSDAFDDSVFEAEIKFTAELEEKNTQIDALSNEIKQLGANEIKLKEEILSLKETEEKLTKSIKELTQMNKNMITTIGSLEKDNDIYFGELKKLRQEIGKNSDGLENTSKTKTQGHSTYLPMNNMALTKTRMDSNGIVKLGNHQLIRQNQILMLGRNIRGYLSVFKNILNSDYDINSQRVDNIFTSEAMQFCLSYCNKYTKEDYVIIFLDAQNVIESKKIDIKWFEESLRKMGNTNVILMGAPLFTFRPGLNRLLADENKVINYCVQQINIVTFNPILTKHIQKDHIAEYILNYCISTKEKTTNISTS